MEKRYTGKIMEWHTIREVMRILDVEEEVALNRDAWRVTRGRWRLAVYKVLEPPLIIIFSLQWGNTRKFIIISFKLFL